MPNLITRHIEPLLPFGIAPTVDSDTVSFKFTVSGADVYTAAGVYTDAATATIKFTPTSADILLAVEAAIEYLKFTPSGVDVHHTAITVDTGTAILLLTASGVDIGPGLIDAATKYLRFTPSAIEVAPPIFYTDAGAVYLDLDFAADDCHSILTPHWDVVILKRWQCVPSNRWTTVAVNDRWDTWVIGVAIDNPCPIPTFEGV